MISALRTAKLTNKRVFLRADLNVPLIDGVIVNDFRLRALQPTLDLLINKHAKIILATHIGRPNGVKPNFVRSNEVRSNKVSKKLTTEYLLDWFAEHEYSITWAATLEEAQEDIPPGTIVLLENLRFYSEEQNGTPEEQLRYAEQLRSLAEYYVNDAWALLHKNDVSITLLPTLFTEKTIGLLIEKELKELTQLRNPERPYVMILGGAKLSKLSFIEQAMNLADTIIVLPALAFTLLKAQGIPVGDSLVDDNLLGQARKLLQKAKELSVELVLPLDYLVGNKDLTGPLDVVQEIPEGKMGISVGSRSLEKYAEIISKAKMVFYNGAMGLFERPETIQPLEKLLQSIARTKTYSIVGGGESVAAVYLFHLEQDISFCSTGGGATLYYVTHGTLPGLSYF